MNRRMKKPAQKRRLLSEQRKKVLQTDNTFSVSHDTTGAENGQALILEIIPVGRKNAVTARLLAQALHWSERKVTKAVQAARLRGVPLCSSCGYPRGYFLAEEPGELRLCIRQMRHREREIDVTIEALEDTMERWEGF